MTSLLEIMKVCKEADCSGEFDEELPDYGDLIPLDEWVRCCEVDGFIDYDGYGNPVKDGKLMNIIICPSKRDKIPEGTTHIMWYNR